MDYIQLLSDAILEKSHPVKSLEEIVGILEQEFIDLTTSRMDPTIHSKKIQDYPDPLLFVKEVIQSFFEIKTFHGKGFIPKFAKIEDSLVSGYNCLGKALAFGAFMRREKIYTRLAMISDHAMCIITLNEDHYLCDPTGWKFTKLHGTFIKNAGYTWYIVDEKDNVNLFYLVIQDFESGALNAICSSFQFLKQHENVTLEEIQKYYSRKEFGILALMEPRFNAKEIVCQLDWSMIRNIFWTDLNQYEKDYQNEWLMQVVYIKRLRMAREIEFQFDIIILQATRRLGFMGNIKNFHIEFIPRLRKIRDQVMFFLETGTGLCNTWPSDIQTYLSEVEKGLKTSDLQVKSYGLNIMKQKLFK